MEPLSAILGLSCLAAGGGIGYWLNKTDGKLAKISQSGVVLQESQSAHFAQLKGEIEHLQGDMRALMGLIDALRATNPELDAAILTHATISNLENLENLSSQEQIDYAIAEAVICIESLIEGVSCDTEVGSENLLSSASSALVERLLNLFDDRGVALSAAGLNPLAAHRLGHVTMAMRRYDLAESAFGLAYQSSPGNGNVLAALEHLAIQRGDDVLRRHWLEARMKLNPDSPELLRAHAHLLVELGDAEAERDVRRLEALGVDTASDRSLLSGIRARAGARSEALAEIEKALDADPNNSGDWYSYSDLLYKEGELSKALEAVEKCLSLDRQNGEAWGLFAKLLAPKQSRAKEALKAATHAVALDAGGVELVLLKANLLEAEGSFVAAEEALLKALDKDASNAELRAKMASRKLLQGDIPGAQQLLDDTPMGIDHALLHVIEGRVQLALADRARDGTGQTDSVLLAHAVSAFDGALSLDRELGIAWLGLARVRRLLRDLNGAGEALDRARRLMADDDVNIATESALLALDNGDIGAASQYIDSADIHGQTSTVSYVRGNIAARSGHLDQALTHFNEALDEDASHIRARLNRSSTLMALDEGKKALDDAEILLDLAPGLTLARLRRAESLMMLGEWQAARDDLKLVLEASAHHHHALTQLAACQMALKRPERAEAPLNEALRIAPEHAPAWHQRGLLYLDWGREESALSDFEAAVRCDGDHLDARLHIAALHHEAQRFDQASAAWRSVLAIDADHQVARTRLDECEVAIMAQ